VCPSVTAWQFYVVPAQALKKNISHKEVNMLWFNFILGLNLIFLYFRVMYNNEFEAKENEMNTKLNHNIYA